MRSRTTHTLLLGCFSAVALSLGLASCVDELDDCAKNLCTDNLGGAAGSAGAAGSESGGTSSGGAPSGGSNSGATGGQTSGGTSSGGASNTCDPECTDGTVCKESTKKCVECLKDANCPEAKQFCDTTTNECVQCKAPTDCGEATAARCDGGECVACREATEADDCGHIEGKPACKEATGECVACTSEADCDGKVCDPGTNTCTELPAHVLKACQECEHDAQCKVGQLCVEMTYSDPTQGSVGSFCLWTKEANAVGAPNGACGLSSRPFASEATVTSVDKVSATVCTLRTTTCPAFLQHATTVSACSVPGTDDVACGAPEFNDGRCRKPGSEAMCTYPCFGADDRDCPAGSACLDDGDRYCSL